ncbi:hypothetical protein Sste5346_006378 [Sporothrix stenoceras]|uniref:SET domain-containing protein n=1 Tax=Sporothrix stenoceras TaxID=5173 RepID=A0ABR3Z0K9_9PEZI
MTSIRLLLVLATTVVACPSSLFTPTPSYPTSSFTDRPLQFTGPHHCVGDVCVYADQGHSQGRGISVVTTGQNIALLESLPRYDRSFEVTNPPPFYESYIIGKGIGLVASTTIRRGDRLMVHDPTLLVNWGMHVEAAPDDREALYQDALDRLPAAARGRFSSQTAIGGHSIHANIETNCFRLFLDGGRDDSTGHLGCYPSAARLNHDCRPNLHYHIHGATQTVVAVRDIAAGEELSISYVDLLLPRTERQERLNDWGFECSCSLCRNETASAEADKRIEDIAALKKKLDSPDVVGDPEPVTANTGIELAILYEDEHLDTLVGQQAYTRAALNCALFAEETCAVAFAHKAMAALLVEVGETAGDLQSMWRLAMDPKAHWAWGLRLKGRE